MELEIKPIVAVLMTTFNGERFLEQQMLSIKNQIGVEIHLFVNDDGSLDGTLSLLSKWHSNGLIREVFHTNSIGSTNGFLSLLTKISGYEYYAFSDQDDIWNESKILTSLEVLNHEKSELVMTARELIDVDNKLINSNLNKKIIPGWNNALVENVAYGNTILINQFARNKILRFLPQGILHFDSWIYLFISTTGKMSYISKPLVMYRIHSNNQIGIRKSFSIKNLIRNLNQFDFQNRALIRLAKDLLEPEKLTLIEKHVGLCSSNNPFAFIFDSNRTFYRQKRIDNFIFKFILPFTGKEV